MLHECTGDCNVCSNYRCGYHGVAWPLAERLRTDVARYDALLKGGELSRSGKGIVLMRISKARPQCETTTVSLGKAGGDAYKHATFVRVKYDNPKEAPIAEVPLEPGDYHVIGYACSYYKTTISLYEGAGPGRAKKSYATFSIATGEVINVGSLTISELPTQVSNAPLSISLHVSDWPLNDIETFKKTRPKLFEQMKVRLMTRPIAPTIAPLSKEECARFVALKRDGKLQSVPTECGAV